MDRLQAEQEISVAILGSGGAGVMTTGELLLAAAARSGIYGVMTRSYGPQIRGGESACFLRFGRAPFEKQADGIDLLLVFDFRNVSRFREELILRPGSWIVYEEAEDDLPAEFESAAKKLAVGWKLLAGRVEGGKGRSNIVALGMLCRFLGFESETALRVIEERFRGRGGGAAEFNAKSFRVGWEWAEREGGFEGFRMDSNPAGPSRWVMTGNQAIVVGSLAGGCDFFAGYPITPASDIMETLARHLPLRGGVMIQAEDEIAAVNMAIGAAFGGRRAMTATSGPGFSLMAEGLGLALMAEIPVVVVDVQRAGPGTGIPTKTEQSDLWAALAGSHGDNPRVVLAPSSVRGCIETMVKAFAIAERYRVPVILLSDQFLGSRTDVLDPIPIEPVPVGERTDPGLPNEPVAPLPVPGRAGGEYTAEGLEHDEGGRPDASHAMHQAQSQRRLKKLAPLASEEGWIERCGDPGAPVGFIGWGSTGGVIRETVAIARAEGRAAQGIIPRLLYPPPVDEMNRILTQIELLWVVELSSLGQFLSYLRSFYRLPERVVPIARAGGMAFRTSELLSALRGASEAQGRV